MEYPTDEAIMRAIQGGEFDLLGVLFTRYSSRAFGRCVELVGDRAAADDLVQDSFLRVLRYRDSFKATSRFSTWLYRIVTNVCLDHLKAIGREAASRRELAADRPNPWGTRPPASAETSLIREGLARLSEKQRDLLVKVRLHGFGYSQLAAEEGVSEGAMRVRVHRAMRELKAIVESLAEEGGR